MHGAQAGAGLCWPSQVEGLRWVKLGLELYVQAGPELVAPWRGQAPLVIRDFLVDQGVAGISGSREAVREAVARQLLPQGEESVWMAMIRSRNLTSHTTNPVVAREIAELIVDRYGPVFQQLADLMQRRVGER